MNFSIPISLIEIAGSGFHIAVNALVNGKPANVLIDTGASQTVFDKNRIELFSNAIELEKAEKLSKGLGTDSMEGYQFTVNQFVLGDIVLDNFEIVALDLSHINASYQELELTAIDMVLGGDFLVQHNAVIDYEKREIHFSVQSKNRCCHFGLGTQQTSFLPNHVQRFLAIQS